MTTAAKTGAPSAGVRERFGTPALVATVLVLAGAATTAAVWFTGAAAPTILTDSGPLIRWGLPVVRAVSDLAQSLTLGLLTLTAVALPVTKPRKAYQPALRASSATAGVWAVAMLLDAVLTYADVSGQSLADPTYGQQLAAFLLRHRSRPGTGARRDHRGPDRHPGCRRHHARVRRPATAAHVGQPDSARVGRTCLGREQSRDRRHLARSAPARCHGVGGGADRPRAAAPGAVAPGPWGWRPSGSRAGAWSFGRRRGVRDDQRLAADRWAVGSRHPLRRVVDAQGRRPRRPRGDGITPPAAHPAGDHRRQTVGLRPAGRGGGGRDGGGRRPRGGTVAQRPAGTGRHSGAAAAWPRR